MDLSKLPRLSETAKQNPPADFSATPPTAPAEPNPQIDYGRAAPPEPIGAQVWISVVLGLLFVMMGWNFARFLGTTLSGRTYETGAVWMSGPKEGQPVSYFELEGYTAWTDTSIFLFGLAMLVEAAVLIVAQRPTRAARALVLFSLVLTVGMTLFNLVLAFLLFQLGITPLMSILAIAFGGFMVMSAWQAHQQLRVKN